VDGKDCSKTSLRYEDKRRGDEIWQVAAEHNEYLWLQQSITKTGVITRDTEFEISVKSLLI
jgi:hypothetical protein